MSGSTNAPVITGIVVGIGFVVLFSVIFTDKSLPYPNYAEAIVVIIPEGASLESSGMTFTQQHTRVFINADGMCCNTVRWVNEDSVMAMIEADDDSDPEFYKATEDFKFIPPGESFEFTFTKEGEFGYHGRPWQQGTIEVVPGFS